MKNVWYFQHVTIPLQYLWYLINKNPLFGKNIFRLYNAFNMFNILFLFEIYHHITSFFGKKKIKGPLVFVTCYNTV